MSHGLGYQKDDLRLDIRDAAEEGRHKKFH